MQEILIRMHDEGFTVVWPEGANELLAGGIVRTRQRSREGCEPPSSSAVKAGEGSDERTKRTTTTTCLQVFAIDSDDSDIEVCENVVP